MEEEHNEFVLNRLKEYDEILVRMVSNLAGLLDALNINHSNHHHLERTIQEFKEYTIKNIRVRKREMQVKIVENAKCFEVQNMEGDTLFVKNKQ